MAEEIIPSTSKVASEHAKILRGPIQIAFDVTNKCNFRCLHCYNRSSENSIMKNELSDNEVFSLIKDVERLRPHNFCICGGEPLLRLNLVYAIIERLSKVCMVSMVTNGSLMTQEIANTLKEKGLKRIQVSIDGQNSTSHEKLRQFKGSFEKAINAIKMVKTAGIAHVGVAFTPTKFNYNEIEGAFDICSKIGINEFRMQPLMLIGRAREHSEELLPNRLQYRHIVKTINKLQYLTGTKMIITWGDPIDHLLRFPTKIDSLVAYVTIRADGGIVASPYLPLIIGNIRRYSLAKYWREGLVGIWQAKIVKQFASKIKSSLDLMKEHHGLPIIYFDDDIYADMIDQKLLKGVAI